MRNLVWMFVLVICVSFSVSCEKSPNTASENLDNDQLIAREFELKKTCFELGRRLYESDFNNPIDGLSPIAPRYGYSKELNTCVLFAGYIGLDGTREHLVDVFSNKELAYTHYGNFKDGMPRMEFDVIKNILFPEENIWELLDHVGKLSTIQDKEE